MVLAFPGRLLAGRGDGEHPTAFVFFTIGRAISRDDAAEVGPRCLRLMKVDCSADEGFGFVFGDLPDP